MPIETGPKPVITPTPEKTRESIRNEEEAMASVFLNEEDEQLRRHQGSRCTPPDRVKEVKKAERRGPKIG
jgi:hypothetical protein